MNNTTTKPTAMTKNEYKQLETLLGQLSNEVGSCRFCIINGVVGEGVQIGTYDNDGKIIHEAAGYDIENCVNILKLKQP